MTSSKTFEAFSRGYGFHPIDWDRPGTGLCISSGSGMMMAIMDACPALRWAIEFDPPPERLADWLAVVDRFCAPIVVAASFLVTEGRRPGWLRECFGPTLGRRDDVFHYPIGTRTDIGLRRLTRLEDVVAATYRVPGGSSTQQTDTLGDAVEPNLVDSA